MPILLFDYAIVNTLNTNREIAEDSKKLPLYNVTIDIYMKQFQSNNSPTISSLNSGQVACRASKFVGSVCSVNN